jgi:transposase
MARSSTARRYTAEFKKDAVALLRSSGRPICVVAKELGVTDTSLGAWARNDPGTPKPGAGAQTQAEKEEDVRLRKRIRELETEIEILKRFTSYWVRTNN